MKVCNMKDPIIITGAPRSGTSLIAGILKICGAFMGGVNPMFENMEIKETLLMPYMEKMGADPTGQKDFPSTSDLLLPRSFRQSVLDILEKQGAVENDRIAVKSNLVSLTWPVWNYAFPNAKYVIVRRKPSDIINSCQKTAHMNAYSDADGWLNMTRFYQSKFGEMVDEGLNCKVIWPHRMAYGDYGQIYELLEWVGLPWKTEILNWVDPKFLKIRKK